MLSQAGEELKFLLDRGYNRESALRFVSNHYELPKKARNRILREIFSEAEIQETASKLYPINSISGNQMVVDGFNVLITVEEGMCGGDVFRCHDGLLRDNAMAFSNYRISSDTNRAADAVLAVLSEHQPKHVTWVFDSQISGSGRLAEYVRRGMLDSGIRGESMTSPKADGHIMKMNLLTGTSDSALIRRLNYVVDIPSAVVDL
ncbi:MAG: DUF434 domain-containing protein [Candidatus Altiarchaeales archaeon]|nr:DUF434 domain-containing protein [Candidatus Altiarchaeales archaeon]MBD3415862.1 DUF434 domain-containing protein [Candidatus Altiarchaeales archaeon]